MGNVPWGNEKERADWYKNLSLSLQKELEETKEREEKYKLALFASARNCQVMPVGKELGKSEQEINQMSVETVHAILGLCDFDRLKEMWIEGGESDE